MVEYSPSGSSKEFNPNCITGDTDHLYDKLKESIKKAKKIDIIVAFLMESGVRLLEDDLREAVVRGSAIRILCGNYLNITQPQALYLLKGSLGDKVDLRFYNVPNKSFHPKAYIFEYDNESEIYIGSSNISRSALIDGIEWNYRVNSVSQPQDYLRFKKTFEDLFLNKSIIVDDNEMRRYSKSWRRPKLFEDIEKLEGGSNNKSKTTDETINTESKAANPPPPVYIVESNITDLTKYTSSSVRGAEAECEIISFPQPMGLQIEALYELNRSRAEGWDKGIVVAATGVGKTFLAAFDSMKYEKVLFVAHREEILFQAERTFKCVRPQASIGYFSGERKEIQSDIILATVQTLGRKEYLKEEFFSKGSFEYIIVDEFHHAVSESYRNIIEYFKPDFLLGLTATPERLDNQDVFALCEYNLIYEVRLKEAINKGWLVPFRYYGVFDGVDYSEIDYKNGKYDEKQLEEVLSINKRAELIYQNYLKYNSKRALGFCSSRRHAIYMAKYFNASGTKACAVISGGMREGSSDQNDNFYNGGTKDIVLDRKTAVTKLIKGEINAIFSVDIFNEGLDIPEIDNVLFLRPTESPTVFLQQLGRGLRKKGNKKYVNVLDFIGNYKKANLIPFFLTGDMNGYVKGHKVTVLPDEEEYPDGCIVNFDFKLIDLFKRMAEQGKEAFDRIKEEYIRIKEDIGIQVLRLSMYTYANEEIYSLIRSRNELNIFKDYLSFLKIIDELTEDEIALFDTKAHDFLKMIENTNMTKMYKMPILLAFYNNGEMKASINNEDIYNSFVEYYSKGSNAVDLLKDNNTKGYKGWGKKEFVSLARQNPIRFLLKSSSQFFYEDGGRFCLNMELEQYFSNLSFVKHYKDIVDYRTLRYYKERLAKRIKEFEGDLSEK